VSNLNSRRDFFKTAILGSMLIQPSLFNAFSNTETKTYSSQTIKIVIFSKCLQNLDWQELAQACKECGLDGVDLTVRDGGHVIPEKVETDLPKVVDIFHKANLEVPMLTTRMLSADDPFTESILKTAGALNIHYVRIGYHKYNDNLDMQEQIQKVKKDLHALTAIAEKYKVVLGYHNHSGFDNFGGPIWDLLSVFQSINSPFLGSNFDIGHAKAEGFNGVWKTNTVAMLPWIRMIAVKDFIVKNHKVEWVPLGTGCVPVKEMLEIIIKKGSFNGPISLHTEYKIKTQAEALEYIKTSTQKIREIINQIKG